MKINLTNSSDCNFYGVSETFRNELNEKKLDLHYEEDTETYTVYDEDGNDIEVLTYEEMQKR